MQTRTKAILLHHVRYSDSSLIAHFYTQEYGRLAVMVRGISSRRGNTRFSYFQPLSIFYLELYYSDKREVQNLKEMTLAFIPKRIYGDINRTSVAMFISEILHSVIREEDVNRLLFDFIESSVMSLDEMTSGISNFHLWFLVAFTDYVGIGPTHTSMRSCYFDMLTGQFTRQQPVHPDFLDHAGARVLNLLLQMAADDISSLKLSGDERTLLLTGLLRYYSLHLAGIREIRSLQVLKDIFK
ncbi:MAG: DNA repair protein RecO [Bacteroidales bacterium]|jgi:DNA repair protein RecO (recombination protein O)|nr:DNA repair protein RecO [Bacteroidales bacterium]